MSAEQIPLDIPLPAAGHVLAAARRSIEAAIEAKSLDPDRDALLIAHMHALAASMDRLGHRIDPRALALLSRELRACADDLGLTREKSPAPDAGGSGPFDFLTLS